MKKSDFELQERARRFRCWLTLVPGGSREPLLRRILVNICRLSFNMDETRNHHRPLRLNNPFFTR